MWLPVASVLGTMIVVLIIGVPFVICSKQIKKGDVHCKIVTFHPRMRFVEAAILAAVAPGKDNVIGVGGESLVYRSNFTYR